MAFAALGGAAAPGSLTLGFETLRSAKGLIQLCLTRDPANFPDCADDQQAIKRTVSADTRTIEFAALPAGGYAIAAIHDENGNAKLDTLAGIPREGVGFSRNPVLLFGPPRFSAARFGVESAHVTQTVRIKYFL